VHRTFQSGVSAEPGDKKVARTGRQECLPYEGGGIANCRGSSRRGTGILPRQYMADARMVRFPARFSILPRRAAAGMFIARSAL
jgi:hypothetical protein